MSERILLDLTDHRARIVGGLRLEVRGSEPVHLDRVDIDTGTSLELLVNCNRVRRPDDAVPTDPVETLSGQVDAWTVVGALSIPEHHWERTAQLTFAPLAGEVEALMGLPLLRAFDILLRPTATDPRRPALEFDPVR